MKPISALACLAALAAAVACRPAPAAAPSAHRPLTRAAAGSADVEVGGSAPYTPPTSTATATATAARPRVTIDSPSGRSTSVDVEVARTPDELERGLMYREKLAPLAGMLFVFPESTDHVFWMKNTLIPLDMIFIDEGGGVAGVVERAEPLTLGPRSVGRSSRYVLEVAGGFAAAHGVRPGDRVRLEGI